MSPFLTVASLSSFLDVRHVPHRRNRNRLERANALWDSIYDDLYAAYLAWEANGPPSHEGENVEGATEQPPDLRHDQVICFCLHGAFHEIILTPY